MIEFKPYEAKPITRMAVQITAEHTFVKHPIRESTYMITDRLDETTNVIFFKVYEEPQVGDWVVRLTQEDTYHCTDAVFHERNIV